MNLLSLEQAQKSYGEKVLLKQANFYLNEGEKVGIIGINGTGKTTLLRILAGTEVPDEGSRTVANHVVLRFLEQNPQMPADMSVLEYRSHHRPSVIHRAGTGIRRGSGAGYLHGDRSRICDLILRRKPGADRGPDSGVRDDRSRHRCKKRRGRSGSRYDPGRYHPCYHGILPAWFLN